MSQNHLQPPDSARPQPTVEEIDIDHGLTRHQGEIGAVATVAALHDVVPNDGLNEHMDQLAEPRAEVLSNYDAFMPGGGYVTRRTGRLYCRQQAPAISSFI